MEKRTDANCYTGTTYFHNATYTCNPGYELMGESFWICSLQGSWSSMKLHENSNFTGTGKFKLLKVMPTLSLVLC